MNGIVSEIPEEFQRALKTTSQNVARRATQVHYSAVREILPDSRVSLILKEVVV